MRPERDSVYLNICRELRELATCQRGQYAALMLDQHGHIVSLGYNGAPHNAPHCVEAGCLMDDSHCVRCLHAEANMLLFADRERSRGSTVYISGQPCYRCAVALVQAGVARVAVDGRSPRYLSDAHLIPDMHALFFSAGLRYEVII